VQLETKHHFQKIALLAPFYHQSSALKKRSSPFIPAGKPPEPKKTQSLFTPLLACFGGHCGKGKKPSSKTQSAPSLPTEKKSKPLQLSPDRQPSTNVKSTIRCFGRSCFGKSNKTARNSKLEVKQQFISSPSPVEYGYIKTPPTQESPDKGTEGPGDSFQKAPWAALVDHLQTTSKTAGINSKSHIK